VHRLLEEIRHTPLLWLLVFVPVVFVGETRAVVMVLLATTTASMISNGNRTAWFTGVLSAAQGLRTAPRP